MGFGFSAAEVLADVEAHGREQTVRIVLTPGRRKQITVNSVKKTASELAGTITAVLFCPEDLAIVREGAAVRRRLMDNAISQLRPGYAAALTEYNRLYEQKSAILRDYREKPSLLYTLDDFSERHVPPLGAAHPLPRLLRGEAGRRARGRYTGSSPAARTSPELSYKTVSTVENPFASEREIYYAVCEHQEAHRKAELESGQCLTGAHRDDMEIEINGKSARTFASQGQKRTAALSIKLGEREIHLQETDEYPVLLLDDVLSELDARRQEFVLNRIGGGQTLITCCEDDGITERTGGRVITIDGGKGGALMYLNIGGGFVVRYEDIVAVFDMDNSTWSRITRDALAAAEKRGEVVNAAEDLPRSFILCSGGVREENIPLAAVQRGHIAAQPHISRGGASWRRRKL